MSTQNAKNHLKFYPPHHFIFMPGVFIFMIYSLYEAYQTEGVESLVWKLSAFFSFLMLFLSVMMRQHYALKLQDRIIINEFKQRYHLLTGMSLDATYPNLSKSQIFALRFASDAELENLTAEAATKNTDAKKIKNQIKNWRADNDRV